MRIVTWNVNSLKARLEHVKTYLANKAPDILMLQELKGLDFPAADFETTGYQTHALGQKAYNGVAIFSKTPITVILNALPGDDADEQARYLEVEIAGLRVINIYLPNGNPIFDEPSSLRKQGSSEQMAQDPGFRRDDAFSVKYDYKLRWMKRLYERLQVLRHEGAPFVIGGDFNVIPEEKDCFDPNVWIQDALYRIETRQAFRKIVNLGLTDAFRVFNNESGHYTFWDYQGGAWQNDKGIRIDHFLLSPEIADRLEACAIDETPRGWDKASDHTPIMIEIAA